MYVEFSKTVLIIKKSIEKFSKVCHSTGIFCQTLSNKRRLWLTKITLPAAMIAVPANTQENVKILLLNKREKLTLKSKKKVFPYGNWEYLSQTLSIYGPQMPSIVFRVPNVHCFFLQCNIWKLLKSASDIVSTADWRLCEA